MRFNYGTLSLEEFGHERPSWYEEGPRPGQVVLEKQAGWQSGARPGTLKVFVSEERAPVSRDGALVLATSSNPGRSGLGRFLALALAKALRPLTRSSP